MNLKIYVDDSTLGIGIPNFFNKYMCSASKKSEGGVKISKNSHKKQVGTQYLTNYSTIMVVAQLIRTRSFTIT